MADNDTRAGKGYIQLPVQGEIGGLRDKIRPPLFYLETEDDQNTADSGFFFTRVCISKAALSSCSSCLKRSPES